MSRMLRVAPLVLLVLIVAALMWRLATPVDTNVRSKLEGQPLPTFALAPALASKPGVSSAQIGDGRPRLVNIFASWCAPCAAEVKVLQQLKNAGVPIDGIAVRDRREDLAEFLARHGNPYDRIGDDPKSAVQIAIGSAGVPETFVIDGRGVVRHQHIGALLASDIPKILAELDRAR